MNKLPYGGVKATVLKAFVKGDSIEDVMRKTGLKHVSVQQSFYKYKLFPTGDGSRMNSHPMYKRGHSNKCVKEAYEKGMTPAEAAKAYGMDIKTVRSACGRAGIKLKRFKGYLRSGEVKDATIEAHEKGMSARAMADLRGMKLYSITSSAHRMGIKLKHHRAYLKELKGA